MNSAAVIAGIAVVVAIVASVIAVMALRVARDANRDYRRIARADSDVVDTLLDRIAQVDASTRTVDELALLMQSTRDDVARTLRHVAVVRYDAFRDLAGRLSFSVALLDDTGEGIVLTSLRGRSETQLIAKGVNPDSQDALTPEEKQAIGYALAATSN